MIWYCARVVANSEVIAEVSILLHGFLATVRLLVSPNITWPQAAPAASAIQDQWRLVD